MNERLTPEEIAEWRQAMRRECNDWPRTGDVRVIQYMLHLHDLAERLRNLRPEDVAGAQIQSVESIVGATSHAWDYVREGDLIAAAVRVMLASLDKPADSA